MAARYEGIDVVDDQRTNVAPVQGVEGLGNTKEVTLRRKICVGLYKHRGIIFVILSATLFALWSTAAKIATQTLAPMEVIAVTSPFATVGSVALCVHRGVKLPKVRRAYLLLVASSMMIASKNISHFFSFEYISLADAITISQLSVIIVGVLGCIFLKEKYGVLEVVFSVMAVLGVAVIARPSFIFGEVKDPLPNYNPLLGITLSLIYALSASIFVIVTKKVNLLGVHPYFNSVFNTAVSSVVSAVLCSALRQWQCPTRAEWLVICAIGAAYFVGQVLFYIALSLENATVVTVIMTFKIVVGFVWQFVFFSILPTWTSACGAGLIAVACVGTIVQNSRRMASEEAVGESNGDFALEEKISAVVQK